MRFSTIMSLVVIISIIALIGCSTKNVGTLNDPTRDTSRFTLNVDNGSFYGGASADNIYLTTEDFDNQVLVSVNVTGAENLKALYFEMEYDADNYRPMDVEPTSAMGPTEDLLQLQLFKDRGHVHYGQILVNTDWRTGLTGDATLATVAFRKEVALPLRNVSVASTVQQTRVTDLAFDGTDTLTWRYRCHGDYNQNGLVEVADLTPLGVYFGASGFGPNTVESCADGTGDGFITSNDITPIGQRFNDSCLGGYNIYESALIGDAPATFDAVNGAGATLIDTVTIPTAQPTERRLFTYTLTTVNPNYYVWVRPMDNASNMGAASIIEQLTSDIERPVLAITNPPAAGSGTADDPYIADVNTDYTFTLNDPTDGNVTASPNTTFIVSNSAGTWTANVLDIDNAFTGDFNITANYDGTLNRTDTTIYMHVDTIGPTNLYIMPDPADADWGSVTGAGTQADPYIMSTGTFNSDWTTLFTMVANTESDGSGTVINVDDLTWDAIPSFVVEDNGWTTKGTFQVTMFTSGYIMAQNASSDNSNNVYMISQSLPN